MTLEKHEVPSHYLIDTQIKQFQSAF